MKKAIKTIMARWGLLTTGKGESDFVQGEIRGIEFCLETLGYDREENGSGWRKAD